jgi:hypothetical protein
MHTANLETINVALQDYENLACSYAKPAGWTAAELPEQKHNLEDPDSFLTLAAAVSRDKTGAFTIGARRRYTGGTLREWLEFFCKKDSIEIQNLREFSAAGMRGYLFNGRQTAGDATLLTRNLYIEDGGVLFVVCAMAAEPFASVTHVLSAMTESFRIVAVKGPTVELEPGAGGQFQSCTLGVTFAVQDGWCAADDGASAVFRHLATGARTRLDRRPLDPSLMDSLQQSYIRANPQAEALRNVVDGVQTLALASIMVEERGRAVSRFRAYTIYPYAEEDAMFVAQTTTVAEHFYGAVIATSRMLSPLHQRILG